MALTRRRYAHPIGMLCLLLCAYAAAVVASLASTVLLLSLCASAVCGLVIGLLFIVGHDACHQSLTPSRRANNLIGRVAFLPSLHPYSLWDLGHNRTHHRYNNVRGKDYVWEPLSPADYRCAPRAARFAYRFFRSPVGIPFYYGVMIWAKRMFLVLPWRMDDRRPAYTRDLLAVWAFLALEAYCLVRLGRSFGRTPFASLALSLLVPFLVWNGLMSFIIYLHHTHPDLPWYRSVEEWRSRKGRIAGTARVRFPHPVGAILLHIMDHSAHHRAPGVPFYRLAPLQEAMVKQGAPAWTWSLREFRRIIRACKLFDYEAGRWCGFESDVEGDAGCARPRECSRSRPELVKG